MASIHQRIMRIVLALMVGLLVIGCSKPKRTATSGGSFEPSPSVTPSPSPSESPKPKVTPYVEPKLTPQQVTLAKQVLQQVKVLGQQGAAMRSLRTSNNPQQEQKCIQLMRQRQKTAIALEKKANTLPTGSPIRVNLATAALSAKLCVTCIESTAGPQCKNVQEYTGHAQSAIAKLSPSTPIIATKPSPSKSQPAPKPSQAPSPIAATPTPAISLNDASKRLAVLDGEGDYHSSYQGYLKILVRSCQQDLASLVILTIATQKAVADSGQTISHLSVLRDASRMTRDTVRAFRLNQRIDCTPAFKLVAASYLG